MKRKPAVIVIAALSALLLQVPGLASQTLTVTEVIVSGLPEPEARRVKALLPFEEGDVFPTTARARRLAAFAQAYLEQDEGFAGVDIQVEEIEAGALGVYVHPRSATIAGLSVFGSTMTTIPNFPVYGLGAGFSVGEEEQLVGLDLPLGRRLSADLAAGHAASADSKHALSAKAGLSFKPLPLLSSYGFAGLDAYLGEASSPTDAYGQAGARLDLGFLSSLILLGPSLEASYRRGFSDYSYSALLGEAALAFEPVAFFRTEAKADLYFTAGGVPPLATPQSAGTRGLRLAPALQEGTEGLASASLTGYLALPPRLKLGVATLSLSLFGFVEASGSFSDLAGLRRLGAPPLRSRSPAAGGGLILELSPPLSLSFELGVGYSLEDEDYAFVLNVN